MLKAKKRPRPEVESRRKDAADKMNYRSMRLSTGTDGAPSTIDAESRSVEVVGATEKPVEVFDYERFEIVPEVLLMDGVEMPSSRQIPLLDSHSRYSTASVLGSFRGMKTEGGQLIGRVHFSSAPEVEPIWTRVREGHLTDFSVGYRVIKAQWVPDGENAVIKGRSFAGPVKVATRWRVKELSAVPIGADELAKARSEDNQRNHQRHDEENRMNEKLKQKLIARGLSADATDDEAWAFFEKMGFSLERSEPKPEPQPEPAKPVDVDKERAEAQRIERDRIAEIDGMCRSFDVPDDMREELIKSGKSIDEARKDVMAHVKKNMPSGIGFRGPHLEKDERDKFREAATDSLLLRGAGLFVPAPAKAAPGADDLRGFTLRELARESLRVAGVRIPVNALEMVGRALTTGDLPYVLGATANKSLLAGYDLAEETWREWCGVGQASDFKEHTLHRVSEADGLEQVPEEGDYQYGKRSEKKEAYSLATYGKIFAITRQAIINDDLGALMDQPAKHGRAAARKVGDVAYAVLTGNANMGDGLALFVAGHGNFVASGAGAVPGSATIAAGILAMGTQMDLNGESYLNIRPRFFIAPKALEGTSEVFFNSFQYADEATGGTPDEAYATTRRNPYAGSYFTRVYDARLDAALSTGWYLAGPKGQTVNVFFLGGNQSPYMESKQGWTVDGVEYKVRIDVAAKAVDWVALYFNYGA